MYGLDNLIDILMHLLVSRILTLGNISTLCEWSSQGTETLTAWDDVPVTSHPPYVNKYSFIVSRMLANFWLNSDTVWNVAKKTTRSASDFPLTAVPFSSEPIYKQETTLRFVFINSKMKDSNKGSSFIFQLNIVQS